jgi:hypothetical protein
MTINITGADRVVTGPTFNAVETITVSTSSGRIQLSVAHLVTQFLSSTATSGPNVTSIYFLPGATGGNNGIVPVEGMEKWLKMTGTGPNISIGVESLATTIHYGSLTTSSDDQRFISAGTGLYGATGVFAFSSIKNNALWLKYMDAQWWVMGGYCTEATGT